ncbi:MAG: N-acetyltransferase [Pseudorhodoplanes sp.]|nr:MAG: N-acetyltransferase [Pseudorhodoplanes sp.]
MIAIRQERPCEAQAREDLLDRAYGPERFSKTSQHLRAGRAPAAGLSFVAHERGRLVGSVQLWDVAAGPGRPALLLGPLAVEADVRGRGIGGRLIRRALADAGRRGHRAVILVGDAAYYARFGFSAAGTALLFMPGAFDRRRLLGCELVAGALDGAFGLISATGRRAKPPRAGKFVNSGAARAA